MVAGGGGDGCRFGEALAGVSDVFPRSVTVWDGRAAAGGSSERATTWNAGVAAGGGFDGFTTVRKAGFNLSKLIVASLLFIRMVKCLAVRLSTLNGLLSMKNSRGW